ncbi:MAG: Gfo/Idh/MocA family oxidoreductase [Armatimonadetes bacterium]|nr:Gfo/Idh/MocA family oxidoreductase [Armatimonadota bacterium]
MKQVRLALVGCGRMGRSLISASRNIPEARLVAAVDQVEAAAREVAAEYGATPYTDMDAALAREDVDAVIIATPNAQHPVAAIAAARAGKHVFTEKPMALNTADAAAMITAARENGVKLMVGQVLRYLVPYVWIIEQVRAGAWGEPFAGQITRVSGSWTGGSYDVAWRHTMAESGGPLFEVHIHEIDFMRQIFGEAEAVWAVTGRFMLDDVDYYDTAQLLVRFAGGKPVQFFTGNCAIEGKYDFKILCTAANIYVDRSTGWVHVRTADGKTIEPDSKELGQRYEPGVQRELREFIEAVAYDRPVPIPGEDGLKAVEIAEAGVMSGQTGKVITLPLAQV